ncbi:endonuclease/exonuclease/phosphatase family protein [Vannielia litorea]|uniref:Metal-dependent hydrolase, endonuclease/exonuclease/phosphatase family n=1 Tax=Vannielia litorea TaxID=1217970 RepID=A0A1N6GMJ4_9RHOB|nr:endonuclease/exonuclease/phosphatase family protein [Vannielia litorea]SIO08740.1 Metal-dependent hydrolase, endonuclease/exonuclease/phosphatase family [Vannielia litorea]
MRRALRLTALLLLALPLLACALHVAHSGSAPVPPKPASALRVASYNVHYIVLNRATGDWSVADWERRRAPMAEALRTIDADIIAFQEMESFRSGSDGSTNLARDYLLAELPAYRAAAAGPWQSFPATQPIFYRATRLRPVDEGWFFFSDTPEQIYSRTFNGSWPAFASWAEFATADGQRLRVVNVHFEYKSRSNRRLSAALVRDRLAPVIASGTPVILLGDLNAMHGANTLRTLEEAGLTFAPTRGATYHLNAGINLLGAIDHIAASQGITVSRPLVLREKFMGEWPSDHYPVYADITLP